MKLCFLKTRFGLEDRMDLIIFTEEMLNRKLHFLCSAGDSCVAQILPITFVKVLIVILQLIRGGYSLVPETSDKVWHRSLIYI